MSAAPSDGFRFAPAEQTDELRRLYLARGYTPAVTLQTLMLRNRTEFAQLPAVIDGEQRLSWRQLIDLAGGFGGYLKSRGVGPGDVVMWQLPNWWEAIVVAYGVWAAGAISAPIIPSYREHEVGEIYRATRPKVVVMPHRFRDVDHPALASAVAESHGSAPSVRVVVRGAETGWDAFEDAVRAPFYVHEVSDIYTPLVIGSTSGTTAEAKVVVHSTASFISNPSMMARLSGYGWRDRAYMPAPLAHATGLLTAVGLPAFTGCSVVLRDRWDPELAIDDITEHEVTFSSGAAVFIQEILDALARRGRSELRLRSGYPCGGSNIPTALAIRAEAVGMGPSRSYGMTECTGVTYSGPFEPAGIRCSTDGRITPGCDVRVIDERGRDLAVGEVGEFVVQGPHRALGYVNPEHTRQGFDGGWFRTGDSGYITEERTLYVTGRLKEIINRGGEKISCREIEDLLVTHPMIAEVAVVAAPHERFGEQPAAFVLAIDGARPSAENLREHLIHAGLAAHKIPRLWHFVDSLPRTPLGKVKKYELQRSIASAAEPPR